MRETAFVRAFPDGPAIQADTRKIWNTWGVANRPKHVMHYAPEHQRSTEPPHARWTKLRPFVRHDARARLISALVSVLVLCGLTWLGVSALTRTDGPAARELRVRIGVEQLHPVCDGPDMPRCSWDDREQLAVDREFELERRIRFAVLDDIDTRAELGLTRLHEMEVLLTSTTDRLVTSSELASLQRWIAESATDVSPAPSRSVFQRRRALVGPLRLIEDAHATLAANNDGCMAASATDLGVRATAALVEEIHRQRSEFERVLAHTERMRAREHGPQDHVTTDRGAVIASLSTPDGPRTPSGLARANLARWLQGYAGITVAVESSARSVDVSELSVELHTTSATLAQLALDQPELLNVVVHDPEAPIWHRGWTDERSADTSIVKPTERYRPSVEAHAAWQLFGSLVFGLAAILLVVVGPIATATAAAREREAGTLPALRMTGMSANDFALAFCVGRNVFALATGVGLLLVAAPILSIGAGPLALLFATALVGVLAVASHLIALTFGDALGQRVGALVVAGVFTIGLAVLGLVGAVMTIGDLAASGMLLGPVPLALESAFRMCGLPAAAMEATSSLAPAMASYTLAGVTLLAWVSLRSWHRRIEHGFVPLFRPLEGVGLGLLAVGASALALVDLSERMHAQSFDAVNFAVFLATFTLVPLFAWLLIVSLRRPARARAIASHIEARRAFLRFHGLLAGAVLVIALAYQLAITRTGVGSEAAEVMWAALAQVLLIVETAVATSLLAARRRDGKHRVMVLGGILVVLELVALAVVYGLEVEHVARTHRAAMPILIGLDASPYWLILLTLLWASGLGLVIAALLRERDKKARRAGGPGYDDEDDDEEEEDEDEGEPARRVH